MFKKIIFACNFLKINRPLKKILSSISLDWYEFLLTNKLFQFFKNDLDLIVSLKDRDALYNHLKTVINVDCELTYVEFGVHEGYSIEYIASIYGNKESTFIGLDSFEGLPEYWRSGFDIGHFNKDGNVPLSNDPRIKYIKGYFNKTWDQLEESIDGRENLLVNYDADLFSSTLYALTRMDSLRKPYYALFLMNFMEMS